MEGLFFLAGLFAVVWLAYWVAQEGRGAPGARRQWSPFDWAEDAAPPAAEPGNAPPRRAGASWRDRAGGHRRR
ncbi:hypothetical protein AruPA_18450 [Acidiphilium sp. PA]|uniref:hypothetical protein n=1 Tax=Acidiphilium sp. PA TaxID=2871705 RepID=UPI002244D1FA|nr:hypothetical protein [Acidiphilium sp. PA]MCW8309018.1 hypothetical protein [Acidiphilium sp. PA]